MAYAALVRCLYLAVAFLHSRGGSATRKIGAKPANHTGEQATMTDSETRITETGGASIECGAAAAHLARREGLVSG